MRTPQPTDRNPDIDRARFSLAHLTLIGCSAPELVFIAARAGYDAVSPRFIPMNVEGEFACFPHDKNLVHAMRTALGITGLVVHEVELARITEDCDPRSFEPALELGGELGAKRLIMSAWTRDRTDRNFLVDCYASTCELAEPYGLTVDLEFPSFSRLRTLDEALDIVRAADQPNGGILVDTLYMHLSRVDIAELIHLPGSLVHFLHIADALPGIPDTREGMIQLARDARLYPGEGCIDFNGIIERLPPVDYSIELPNHSRVAELGLEEHARRCLSHAKRTFGAARSQRRPAPDTHLTSNIALARGTPQTKHQTTEETHGSRAH